MPGARDGRFVEFQRTLNRTINKTVSEGRLTILPGVNRNKCIVASSAGRSGAGGFQYGTIPLGNHHFLSVLMVVRLAEAGVTTEKTSISYRATDNLSDDQWIIRYEYEPAQARSGDYLYPVAHLHVNARPEYYRGAKPFPDLHLPTCRLSLEAIVRHLIVEHDVPPLCPTDEALTFLDHQDKEFQQRRSDPDRPAQLPG